MPSLRQPRAASAASSGGSRSETKVAPSAASMVCTATRLEAMASARPASSSSHAVVFSTVTATLQYAPSPTGVTVTRTIPSTGIRSRTKRPTDVAALAAPASSSIWAPPSRVKASSASAARHRRREVERREVDDAVERLVPLDVPRPVDLQ